MTTFRVPQMVLLQKHASSLEFVLSYAKSVNKHIDTYGSLDTFLAAFTKYPEETVIAVGYFYDDTDMTGLDILKILHDRGYKYLYSSLEPAVHHYKVPDYATFIDKSFNTETMKKLIDTL